MAACCSSKTQKIQDILTKNVETFLKLRLTNEEKKYHTNLFFDLAVNNAVSKQAFPELMGLLGTEIATTFAIRIFDIFSSDKKQITLGEYLKYIDIYHHGEENERCLITYKLIDKDDDQKVTEKEFMEYINLIIAAVKKVQGSNQKIISESEMRQLYKKIAKDKSYFNLADFEEVYYKKPHLLSWLDYFKNDDVEIYSFIDKSVIELLRLQFDFFKKLNKVLSNSLSLNGNHYNFDTANETIEKFLKIFQIHKNKLENMKSNFTIRGLMEKLKKKKQEKYDSQTIPVSAKHEKKKFILDDGIKIDDISLSFKNINNLLKKTSMLNFEKLKKNISPPIDAKKDLKISFKSDEKLESESHNKEVKPFFLSDEAIEDEGLDKISIEKIGRNVIRKITFEENKEKLLRKEDEMLVENNSKSSHFRNSKNVNLGRNNSANRIDDTRMKKLFKKNYLLHSESDLENPNLNPNLSIFNTNKSNQRLKPNITVETVYPINPRMSFSQHTNRNHNKQSPRICIENFNSTSDDLGKYNNYIKVFMNSLQKLSKTNLECISFIFYYHSILGKKFFKFEETGKYRRQSKINNTNMDNMRISKANIPSMKIKKKNNILNPGDTNFKLILTMIMGVQLAVQSSPNIDLTDNPNIKYYAKSMKYSLGGAFITNQETYYITDFGEIIFNNIRKLYGISKESYIQSISPQDMITEIMISYTSNIEQLCSTGKSGSLFYYTRDAKFILKTISLSEYECMKRILPNYFKFLLQNRYTFLPKFFGCYKLVRKLNKKKQRFYFIIMDNLFSTNKEIHLRYDLKGSIIGRQELNLNDSRVKYDGGSYALKDLDMDYQNKFLIVGEKKEKIVNQLKSDTEFLRKNNIIDYSLLVGIHIKDHDKNIKSDIPFNVITNNQNNNQNNIDFKEEKETLNDPSLIQFSENSLLNYDLNYTDNSIQNQSIEKEKHPFKDFIDGGIMSNGLKEIYYVGIIDILTDFNTFKKCEYVGKLFFYCSQKMSCVPPDKYQTRFCEYMESKLKKTSENENKN